MTCSKCRRKDAPYLHAESVCGSCYETETITDLPCMEKRSFTIPINTMRRQARRQKKGSRKLRLITQNKRTEYQRQWYQKKKNEKPHHI